MKRTREFERQARRVAQAAAVSRFVTPMLRDAISDPKVRAAAGDTYEAGRRMFEDVRGSDPRNVAGRMARDQRLQNQVTALVRSATNAVDEGIASGHRRLHRRVLRFVTIGGGVAWLVAIAFRRKFASPSPYGDGPDVRVTEAPTPVPYPEPTVG
jgi:hypothetical protein